MGTDRLKLVFLTSFLLIVKIELSRCASIQPADKPGTSAVIVAPKLTTAQLEKPRPNQLIWTPPPPPPPPAPGYFDGIWYYAGKIVEGVRNMPKLSFNVDTNWFKTGIQVGPSDAETTYGLSIMTHSTTNPPPKPSKKR